MRTTLKYERGASGFTQAQLAKMTGVTRKTISAIENGDNHPSLVLAVRLALVFQKPVESIFIAERKDLTPWIRRCR